MLRCFGKIEMSHTVPYEERARFREVKSGTLGRTRDVSGRTPKVERLGARTSIPRILKSQSILNLITIIEKTINIL